MRRYSVPEEEGADDDVTLKVSLDLDHVLNSINTVFFTSFSIVDLNGNAYGFIKDVTSVVENDTGRIVLFSGEFRTNVSFENMDQMWLFLKGMYLMVFDFKDENSVRDFVNSIEPTDFRKRFSKWFQFMFPPA